MTKKNKEEKKDGKPGPTGPMKFTPEVVQKLKVAFTNYANIAEACFYAGITTGCFYYNAPKDSDLFNELLAYRFDPKLRAKQTVCNKLASDVDVAWRFLKNTSPTEFAEKQIVEDVTKNKPGSLSDRAKELAKPFISKDADKNNKKK